MKVLSININTSKVTWKSAFFSVVIEKAIEFCLHIMLSSNEFLSTIRRKFHEIEPSIIDDRCTHIHVLCVCASVVVSVRIVGSVSLRSFFLSSAVNCLQRLFTCYVFIAEGIEYPDCPPSSEFVRGTNYPCSIICFRIPGWVAVDNSIVCIVIIGLIVMNNRYNISDPNGDGSHVWLSYEGHNHSVGLKPWNRIDGKAYLTCYYLTCYCNCILFAHCKNRKFNCR